MTDVRRAALAILVVGGVSVAGVSVAAVGTDGALATTRTPIMAATAAAGTWGTAREVPGSAALNKGKNAQVNTMSCASASNCSAGGFYNNASLKQQAFVVNKVNGIWHKAIEVPGTGTLNTGGGAAVSAISCASAGNCTAGGSYSDRKRRGQTFVVSEVKGAWHKATHLRGTTVSAAIGQAQITSMSCVSPGNCTAAGYDGYVKTVWRYFGFVASEVHGAWHAASRLPGLDKLSTGMNAEVSSVSCKSAGNCSASGYYSLKSGALEGFVANEAHGTWHNAIEVPGLAKLAREANAWATKVSCGSAGNCSAGGHYQDASGHTQAFVANEVNGRWHNAIEVPGLGALNKGGDVGGNAGVNGVSCASAGNCTAGGYYRDAAKDFQAFVVREVNGTWHTAIEVPGIGGLNKGGDARVYALSCASTVNCSAGGAYIDSIGRYQAWAASEVNGTWHAAVEVPGTATLNKGGYAQVDSVSCGAVGRCNAGGVYSDSARHWHAFVVSGS